MSDQSPCRWVTARELESDGRMNLVDLSSECQAARGRELLDMLHHLDSSPQETSPPLGKCPNTEDEVTVTVRHTFIELVRTPTGKARARAMTDSELDNMRPEDKIVDAVPLPEISDASTDATLEPEDQCDLISECPVAPTFLAQPEGWYGEREESHDMASWWGNSATDDNNPYAAWSAQWQWVPPNEYGRVDTSARTFRCGPSAANATVMRRNNTNDQTANTTVMLRNLPNDYTRDALLDLLDQAGGFARKYDFVYLPIDFKSQAGLGYAFVNFVSPAEAERCKQTFEGFSRWGMRSSKVCSVTWGNPLQGYAAHVERYRDSPVMHESVPDEWKPILLAGGVRQVFPPPTKHIKAPKLRTRADK